MQFMHKLKKFRMQFIPDKFLDLCFIYSVPYYLFTQMKDPVTQNFTSS